MQKLRVLIVAACAALAAESHAVGSLASLEVFDRTANLRLPVHWHAGSAWVVGVPGNEYTVSVRSRQGADVLAVVSVDGVNVVSGETAHPRQTGYVISPYRTLDIKGWRKNMAETAAFYFTSLGDSYAARTGRPEDVGVIGVALFRRKPADPPPVSRLAPAEKQRDEARGPAAGTGAANDAARASAETARRYAPAAPIGTGHGRREESHARHVGFERASSEPAEIITLRYDSRANLVAMGVIREPAHAVPRPPRPFPGFVPDPVSAWPLPAPSYPG